MSDPTAVEAAAGPLAGSRGQLPWAHTKRTALNPKRDLGSAEVVHPFHPLRGQRLALLKVRIVSGVETLILRHGEFGSVTVLREWTDLAPPGSHAGSGGQGLLIDAYGLVTIVELTTALLSDNFEVD
jgi:Family of unknown function (DUF5372)